MNKNPDSPLKAHLRFDEVPVTCETRVIATLLYYKTCAPRASDRELARVLSAVADRRIHNETVKALLERYPLWRYPEFQPQPSAALGASAPQFYRRA
jgi:hypothetical protein